jgi:hypothetical protein
MVLAGRQDAVSMVPRETAPCWSEAESGSPIVPTRHPGNAVCEVVHANHHSARIP